MKKVISILLVCFMLGILAGCQSGESTETKQPFNSTAADVESNTQEIENNTQEVESIQPEDEIKFDTLTAVDNDECAITITGIEPDNLWGFTMNVELENKSEEKTYMFSVMSASVDDVQSDPFFASEVAAGKKSVDSISFTDSTLKDVGVGFTDIELVFRVYDSNDWMADSVAEEAVHVYPYGEEKASAFERTPQPSDNVIIDNDCVTVTVIGYDEEDIWGYTVNFFLQNKIDAEVMFAVDEVSVNGYMADPFWAKSVMPGKCAFSSMAWSKSTLEDNGITGDIEEIEFLFRAYNNGDFLADDFANETITLTPDK